MADAPTIYHYSKETGELVGQSVARLDPIDKEPLIPANSTLMPPPSVPTGKAAVFAVDAWSLVPDHRGETYYDAAGDEITIDELGVVPDAGWTTEPPPIPLADLRRDGEMRVDAAAERTRMQYITPGAGQALVYELKRSELQRYDADIAAGTTPKATDYPLMNERATRTATTLDQVATEWRTTVQAWMAVAAQIEGLREAAKEAINAVADDANAQANIDAIVTGITWPAPE